MILLLECIVACAVFTAIMLPSVYRDPLAHIMSYPTAIRKRVESLPQYQGMIHKVERKHVIKKVVAAFVCIALLAVVAYYSGARDFTAAFWHVFLLFLSVNAFDAIVLDIMIFCHSTKTMIPGTEDMVAEYRSPWHHIKGFFIGQALGLVVALLAAGFVVLIF